MAEGCPHESKLIEFSNGTLTPEERAAIASHALGCPDCGPRLGALAQQVVAGQPTQLDSPAASRRRISLELARSSPPGPPVPNTPIPDDGTHDTVISLTQSDPNIPRYLRGAPIDRYVVLERLGKGGMGEVYSAYDPDLDRKVALKLLRPDFAATATADELRVRLVREAQAMARLSHPNVVTVHDVGIVNNQVFVAMEFVEGQTATQWLKEKRRAWTQVLDVFISAGKGLWAAHSVGITHRDFKPDNVIVAKDGRVKVMDFGLAQARVDPAAPPPVSEGEKVLTDSGRKTDSGSAMRRRITPPGTVMGTPAYMSPEQFFGKPTDPRSDQFSFGVALYEALYGERPFAGETAAAIAAEISLDRVRPVPPGSLVPQRIRKLLLKALRNDPAERFKSIDALLILLSRRKSAVVRQRTLIALAAVVAGTIGLAVYTSRATAGRCAQVADRLEGVWDPGVRAQAKKAFLATGKPWAGKSFDEAAKQLDQYTGRWLTLRVQACEARETAPDEQLGERITCLGRRLADVQAVAQLFTKADDEIVERALNATLGLPSLDACLAPGKRPKGEAEQVRLALPAVKARLDAGKYADGLDLAKKAVEQARAANDRATLAEAEYLLAVLSARTGDTDTGDKVLLDSALDADATREDELAARAWIERVGLVALAGRAKDAEEYARIARAALDRAGGDAELEASLDNNLGVLAWTQGKSAEAADWYGKAVELRKKTLGPNHPLVARSLSNLGAALRAQGKYDDAIAAYKQAQGIEEAVLDPSHPAVAETLNNLGNALNDKGESGGAVEAFQRSLAIKERAFGPDSPAVAITLTNLGGTLIDRGRDDEAIEALERAVTIKEKAQGKESLSLAVSLTNLAAAQRGAKHPDKALALDERALAIREKAGAKAEKDLAFNLTGIGAAYVAMNKADQALLPLERALILRAKSSPSLQADTQVPLVAALMNAKKGRDLKRAEILVRQAVINARPGSAVHDEALRLAGVLDGMKKR
ncbi:MAG: serine/threonine-protein kinase [Myxococcaceae bacterium]